jgi:hypothetical protein
MLDITFKEHLHFRTRIISQLLTTTSQNPTTLACDTFFITMQRTESWSSFHSRYQSSRNVGIEAQASPSAVRGKSIVGRVVGSVASVVGGGRGRGRRPKSIGSSNSNGSSAPVYSFHDVDCDLGFNFSSSRSRSAGPEDWMNH